MNLLCDFSGDMGQPRVINYLGVRAVATEDYLLDAKPLAGAKNTSHVVSTANIVSNNDNFWHDLSISLLFA